MAPSRPPPTSRVPVVAVLAVAATVGLASCRTDDTATGGSTPEVVKAPAADPDAFARKAHKAALLRLTELGGRALALADPVSAFRLGHGPLAAPPMSRTSRAPLREAVHAAVREGEGIDRSALSPEDGMLRTVVATALQALRRDLDVRPALRRDPTVFAAQASGLVDLIEEQLRAGPCHECPDVLVRLGQELERAQGQLGATSSAGLWAARQDLQTVDAQLAAMAAAVGSAGDKSSPAWTAALARARAGTAAVAARLAAIADGLADAPRASWQSGVSGAVSAKAVRRLPDRLGTAELARRLIDDEGLSWPAKTVAAELTLLLARLTKMRDNLPPAAAAQPSGPTPVTAQRCLATWAPLKAWARTQGLVPQAEIDCASERGPVFQGPASDPRLVVRQFEWGIVRPSRQARRKAVPKALALSSARMASAGQRLALTVSGLIGAGQPEAARLAIADARAQLCVALAAILEHGEIGEPESRTQRLSRDCPTASPQALVERALARPRQALAPAGMVLINKGPAQAAALSRFWWAPLGLVMPLADPARSAPPDPALRPPPAIEPLVPDGVTRK